MAAWTGPSSLANWLKLDQWTPSFTGTSASGSSRMYSATRISMSVPPVHVVPIASLIRSISQPPLPMENDTHVPAICRNAFSLPCHAAFGSAAAPGSAS